MKHLLRRLSTISLLFCLSLLPTAGFSQICSFKTLHVPTQGVSNATSINDAGAIVGNFFQNARSVGYLLFRGKFTIFKFPGADETTPHNINNRSQIVGDYLDINHVQHGFIVQSGGFQTVDVIGQPRTMPLGINDLGDIVGLTTGPFTGTRGFIIFHNRQETIFGVPGSIETEAWSINNQGEIVGSFQDNTGRVHGFRLKNGVFTTVDFPGAASTQLRRINEEGEVVGNYTLPNDRVHGFSLDKGVFKTIDNPRITPETLILGLNNRDQIVGGGDNPNQAFFADCRKVF